MLEQPISGGEKPDSIDQVLDLESKLTPWEVKGKVDYLAQIVRFGTNAIDGSLIERWERVTGQKVHRFIRRGLVFSHQDLDKILDCVEAGVPIFLYTGRGPSSDQMHLGHKIPFELTKYLQDSLNCLLFIQMSDDEKFLFKDGSGPLDLERYRQYSYSNAREIIACGFDPHKTLIFSNLESNAGDLYFNNVLLMKSTNANEIKAIYGLGETLPESVRAILTKELAQQPDATVRDELRATLKKFSSGPSNNLGQCTWPAFQCGPAFCTSFRQVFIRSIQNALAQQPAAETLGQPTLPAKVRQNLAKALKELQTLGSVQSIMCLVPMAIDQAPYFRMARDAASVLKCPKPAVIHSEFLPDLKQSQGKMSTTGTQGESTTLFLNMTPKQIEQTIKRHAFSGGREKMEDHRLYGGDIRVDICYQYLTYFIESDDELKEVARQYTSGEMSSGQIKALTAKLIAQEMIQHQTKAAQVTPAVISQYFNWNRTLDIGGCHSRPPADISTSDTDYAHYGINFDRTFGYKCREMPTTTPPPTPTPTPPPPTPAPSIPTV